MRINFFYEYEKSNRTESKYRAIELGNALKKRGHDVTYTEEDIVMTQWDILVIDHTKSKKDMIMRAKQSGTKVMLLDGDPDDVELVDVCVSAFINRNAHFRGSKYIIVPRNATWDRYRPYTKSRTVFIGVGDFDITNIAEFALDVLNEINLNAIVVKSTNHYNFRDKFSRIEMFEEENYYNAMHECVVGITDGGTTFLQSLHYGMPVIPLAQNDSQQTNIDYLQHCCLPIERNKDDLITKIGWLIDNEYYRKSLGMLASHFIDGKGTDRICKIIEDLKEN